MFKKAIFLLLVILSMSLSFLFAEEQNESVNKEENVVSAAESPQDIKGGGQPQSQAKEVVSQENEEQTIPPPQKSGQKLVTAIEVKGNKSTSTNRVVAGLKTKIGAPYQENIISDDLKRLYLLGFFSNIKIDTEDYKGGFKVIIIVKERPVIEKISFSGMKHITMRDEKLKETLKSKETQYLDDPNLKEDEKTLRTMYAKKGFSKCKIESKVDIDEQNNKAKILFTADEGRQFKIKKILIEGNENFKDNRILKLMKTKQAWLFNSGVLRQEFLETEALFPSGPKVKKEVNVLDEDRERIKVFYQTQGFSDIKVNYAIKEDSKNPFFYITVVIQEGKKYLVGNVTIEGNKEIPLKDILEKLKECVTGKVFSQEALKKDVANIQSLYFDRGYISMQAQETTSLNPYTNRVDIHYNIIENEIVYVNKINIKGNVKTKDVVIRRELRIGPGDKFDGDKLKRSKERLQNLGFFEEVSYDTEDTGAADKKNLAVNVKETKTGAFSFGGGYSTVDQFVGFVEVEQKNFDWRNFPYFTGAGQDLRLRASFGTVSEGFDLSFTEPWVFDYPVSFGFDAYKRTHKRESDVGYGYDEDTTGGDLRLGKEISEYTRASLMYRYDRIDIGGVTDDATNDLKKEEGTNAISSMELGVSFDTRDNIFDTTKGDLLSGSVECAGGPFGADKDFFKFSGRASHYFPLLAGSVLEFRGRMGIADSYGNSEEIPIYERYFVGGADTVRGYHERKIGPIDSVSKDPLGGNSLLIGNIEYLYPFFSFLKAAVFYDVGNVWSKISDLGSGGFKSSVGFGLRIKSPIGPIMLDYGIPFNKESGEDKKSNGRFHFSASHGF
ncbi:MAG: outer membrane protein assembly factor BamA [Candidatus Omnitrophota bacterium]